MAYAFEGCISLTGTIKINSENITTFQGTFDGITNNLTVQVPANSKTYTELNRAYGESTNIIIETF